MSTISLAGDIGNALATARATPGQRRVAMGIAGVALLAFIVVAPFVRTPLPKLPAFIPAY